MKTLLAVCASSMLIASGAAAQDALVRAVHASPGAPPVDVRVNGAVAIPGLAFGQASAYAALAPATYNFQVVETGTIAPVFINADLSLGAGQTFTVAAINVPALITPLVLEDDNTLDPTSARIRFVHASPNAPGVTVSVVGGPQIFGPTLFGNSAGYASVAPGTYDLVVRLAEGGADVLTIPGVTANGNTVYSVFALGLVGSNDTPLQAALFVDAIPAPGAAGLLALAGLAASRRRR